VNRRAAASAEGASRLEACDGTLLCLEAMVEAVRSFSPELNLLFCEDEI
jgi:hypothetical protein